MNLPEISEKYIEEVRDFYVQTTLTNIHQEITKIVSETIGKVDIQSQVEKEIINTVQTALTSYNKQDLGQNIISKFKDDTSKFLQDLTQKINDQISTDIRNKTNLISISELITKRTNDIVKSSINTGELNFPNHSIKLQQLDLTGLTISADVIVGGRINKFESTGIQDLSTECKITITDQTSIFENKISVGDIDITGNLNLLGKVPGKLADAIAERTIDRFETKLTEGVFEKFTEHTLLRINNNGLDFSNIKYKEDLLINDGVLNSKIHSSNLQKVGVLNDLIVVGEILLDDTLFVSGRRFGVNTINPEYTMELWDQEVQFVFSKQEKNVGFIGSKRKNKLIFGTSDKNNLICEEDGSITVEKIKVGFTRMSSAAFCPSENRERGEIVWNEQPQIGAPIGWVSLGGARWAQFGTIS
ncbi:hypothetical protein EBU71_15430 [bacterium]|jgi:hypothetical protein|nr:hypothetical protein [Candidatus Elulimicrobium humile]